MTTQRTIELMETELRCIRRANTCDRDCGKCDLVQKDYELTEAYNKVLQILREVARNEQ